MNMDTKILEQIDPKVLGARLQAARRSGAGLYVLAFLEASLWLVPRTGFRLQLRARARALDWD